MTQKVELRPGSQSTPAYLTSVLKRKPSTHPFDLHILEFALGTYNQHTYCDW